MNRRILLSIFLFCFVYAVHSASFVVNSIDSMWVLHTAHSIVNEGNLNLNEFREEVKAKDRYGVRKRNNSIYNYFPYGTSLLAAPFIYIFDTAPELFIHLVPGTMESEMRMKEKNEPLQSLSIRLPLEKAIASALVAITTVVIFLTALQYISSTRALILALVFAFTTPAWSVLSRGLWQHGPSVLMHSLALLCFIYARENKKYVLYSAPFLVYSFFVRPTNAVAIIAYSVFILLYYREYFIKHCLLMLAVSVPFIAVNFEVFEKIIPQYFNPNRLEPNFNAIMPILANLVSPSRGLLFLSPIFFFAILAFFKDYYAGLNPDFRRLSFLSLAVIVLHITIVSIFPNWWGGHCFGARYMSDTISYFTFLLIPLMQQISFKNKKILTVTFVLSVIVSVLIHYRGANAQIVYMWNTQPTNIDNNPNRAWDTNDIQVLRGL